MSTEYSAVRPAGREHFPSYPKGFIAIRIVQLVIAVIILGIDAFTLSRFAWRANGLNAFTVSTCNEISLDVLLCCYPLTMLCYSIFSSCHSRHSHNGLSYTEPYRITFTMSATVIANEFHSWTYRLS